MRLLRMKISDLFYITNARSKGFEDHENGDIPFVSNGLEENNGIVGFVKPLAGEKIFHKIAICVSAFCEATIQRAPFLPRGNGGSGMVVLSPKEEMTEADLYFYAAQINLQKWRFSFGRMVINDRLKLLEIEKSIKSYNLMKLVSNLLPNPVKKEKIENIEFSLIPLSKLFEIKKGKGKYYENCEIGDTPLVSATGKNNGIIGHVNLAPIFKAPMITLERVLGNAFVQLEDFVTVPDDIFVLEPKNVMSIDELFYCASVLNTQKWRFNYSRKMTPIRFKKLSIAMPINKNNEIDINAIRKLVTSNYGWEPISSFSC